jgi:hypothetical protein
VGGVHLGCCPAGAASSIRGLSCHIAAGALRQ